MSNISGAQEPLTTTGGGGGGGNVNVTQIASGATATTGVTGEQLVGIVGATGATLDVAQGGATAATDALQVAGVYNTPPITLTNGQASALQLNPIGAQLIAGAQPVEATAAWTSATAGNTVLQVNCVGYQTAIVTLNQGSTITGGQVLFQISDTAAFTNVYTIFGVQQRTASASASTSNVPAGAASQYTLVASTNITFLFNVSGYAAFQVILGTVISGTATVNVGIQLTTGTSVLPVQISSLPVVSVNAAGGTSAQADNLVNTTLYNVSAALGVSDSFYGGAFSGTANGALSGWSKARTATVFKTASVSAATTGNSAVWTPGSGNKFRLLGYQITAQGLAATSTGVVTVSFQDSASAINIGTYDVDVPAVAGVVTGVMQISGDAVYLGTFGVLSAAANNVLNFNISAAGAGTVGTYRVTVWGTEE